VISAQEALERLKEGNRRFVASIGTGEPLVGNTTRAQLVKEMLPFATILGCSDARVPAEIVFDQGLGDLFVIRVAGNIVAPSQIDSVEFASARAGTPLVVVLGHTECGAVHATIEELSQEPDKQSHSLRSIVDRVRPSVEGLLKTDLKNDLHALVRQAVRSNVAVSVNHLRYGSAVLEKMVRNGDLLVVGAEYSIETGVVEFLDEAGA
jgi:carbonic anhydrase